jgi:hypothetical protein
MGNRAVITTAPYSNDKPGIYLHWNGGRDSVEAFLKAAEQLGYRAPTATGDLTYGMARLVGLLCTFLGLADDTCIGIGLNKELDTDNGDNGVYVIEGWKIVERLHHRGPEQAEYNVDDFAAKIVAKVRAAHKASEAIGA